MLTQGSGYLHQLIGVLGWLDAPLPHSYVNISIVALTIAFILSISTINIIDWFLISVSASISCLLVFVALYADWSPVHSAIIVGVQGRYFTPILPFMLIIAYPFYSFFVYILRGYKKVIASPKKTSYIIKVYYSLKALSYFYIFYIFPFLTFIFSVNTIITRYYLV